MPIEELLALYRGHRSDDDGNDEDTERPRSSSSCSPNELDESDGRNFDKDDIDEDEDESELRNLYPETFDDNQRHHLRSECLSGPIKHLMVSTESKKNKTFLFTALSRPLSEEEDDGDYSPDEDDVKKVRRHSENVFIKVTQ